MAKTARKNKAELRFVSISAQPHWQPHSDDMGAASSQRNTDVVTYFVKCILTLSSVKHTLPHIHCRQKHSKQAFPLAEEAEQKKESPQKICLHRDIFKHKVPAAIVFLSALPASQRFAICFHKMQWLTHHMLCEKADTWALFTLGEIGKTACYSTLAMIQTRIFSTPI